MNSCRLLAAVACGLLSCQVDAATLEFMRFSENSPLLDAVLEGEIVEGDFELIESELRARGPEVQRLFLYSPGGDVLEAIKLGELIRTLQIATVGPRARYGPDSDLPRASCSTYPPKNAANCVCYSSCFLLWVAGMEREESMLGVHRPSFDKAHFAAMSPEAAERLYSAAIVTMQSYLGRFGVPQDVKERMVSTPSRDIHVFVSSEAIGGTDPAYDELLDARCDLMTRDEEARFWFVRSKVRQGRASYEEGAEFLSLEKRYVETGRCAAYESLVMRVNAFSEYFGIDYASLMRRPGRHGP